eukprot:GGOE01009309.1.p1 GENE.GGOE01009309.1~~GGOE01009309.1.p1  ORF type:complete len:860 (+),score=213.24 GGOE01009309.1:48-2582(+)
MADDVCQGADGAFDAMGPEAFPCFEPARPPRLPRLQCSCSLSIMVLVLTPTVCVMVAVALIAWFMIHNTASNAVEVIGHEGQRSFVVAMRFSILAYTATVQRINSVNRPRWENTTCDGAPTVPNASAFDAYDDVRLALWSQLFYIKGSSSLAGVGFPCGSVLAYQLTSTGSRWIVVDKSTDFWVWMVNSTTWKEDWANGTGIYSKPDDLIEADLPYNISARVWFTDAVKNGRQSWSAIFYSLPMGGLSLPAVMPIYHPNGALKLVSQAEISLKELDSFFTGLLLTPNTFAFIAELDGSLVASVPAGLSTALPSQQSATGAIMTRVISQEAGDARIAGAAAWLVAQYGSLAAVPVNDSGFVVPLVGRSHYLFSGHIQDEYGLHWVIVIGLPRSDLLGDLDETSLEAILIIVGVLLVCIAIIGAVTLTIRRNLQLFSKRIKLMGTMDLEGAKQPEGVIFLSEARLILLNLRNTINNLLQFRTFLPQTMLEKVRQMEDGEEETPAPHQNCLHPQQSLLPPQALPAEMARSMLPLHGDAADSSRQSGLQQKGNFHRPSPCKSPSLVHAMLDRRMEYLPVTLVCLELPNLNSVQLQPWVPSDFMLWYETCLGTALGVLQQCNGDFYRLMGDQLLFSWGAMRRVAGQCSKACHAAWHLSQALRALDAQATMSVPYAPQISVVTGTALCGVMGTNTTRDTYLIGPLVKLGARLTSLNGSYGTHILLDAGVARQCETLFQLQVCGLVYGTSAAALRPVLPIYELLSPMVEDAAIPKSDSTEEWMYRLALPEDFHSGYQSAMDALRRGLVQQAQQELEAFLEVTPHHPHARRVLDRINSRGKASSDGLWGLVD